MDMKNFPRVVENVSKMIAEEKENERESIAIRITIIGSRGYKKYHWYG